MKNIKAYTFVILLSITSSLKCMNESLPLTQNMVLYNTTSLFSDPEVLKEVKQMLQAETKRTNESIHFMRVRNYLGVSIIASWIIWAYLYGPEEKCEQCKALKNKKKKNIL